MMGKRKDDFEDRILDVDASMQGTITFKDPVNLRINGSFEGKLDTRGNLTIGENAKVKANIVGERVIIAGKVTGDVSASHSVTVIAPAVIQGNISTPRLSVTEGALIEGKLSMSGGGANPGLSDSTMSLKDVAQYLEVEARVVEEWAAKKKIPARQENGNWIFQKSAVERWIQEENVRA